MPRRAVKPAADRPQRVVLYRRVSALMGRSGDDFHSPDIQLTALRQATAGMAEVAVVDDFDQTGRTFDREGLNKIRGMVEAGLVDTVAFYNITRLGRNALEGLLFVADLERHGVRILSATEHVDTSTAAGRYMLTNMLAVAQQQSDQIGEGWSRTIAARARAGHFHGATPPYGYRRVKADSGPARVELDPVAAPIVARVFDMYTVGEPVGGIVRYLSAARGRPINRSGLKRILHNPFYAGQVRLAGEVFPGRHDALIDADMWGRVQDRLRREATTPARRLAPVYGLTGLVFCEACRRPMVARKDRGQRRLECQAQSQEYGCPGAGQPLVDLLEAAVLGQVALYIDKLLWDPAAAAARQARHARLRADVAVVKGQLKAARADMLKLTEAWRRGTIPDWVFEEQMRQLRDSEVLLSAQLAEFGAPHVAAAPAEQVSLARRLVELWPEATPGERRRMIGLVVQRVWVRRAGFWREPVQARVRVETW